MAADANRRVFYLFIKLPFITITEAIDEIAGFAGNIHLLFGSVPNYPASMTAVHIASMVLYRGANASIGGSHYANTS